MNGDLPAVELARSLNQFGLVLGGFGSIFFLDFLFLMALVGVAVAEVARARSLAKFYNIELSFQTPPYC